MSWAIVAALVVLATLIFTFACFSVGADADQDPTTIEPPMEERR